LLAETTYHFRVKAVTQGGRVVYGGDRTLVTTSSVKTLNLKLYLEGLYAGGGTMNQASDATGPHFGAGIADQITVELHNTSNYATVVYTASNVNLGTNGVATFTLPGTYGGSYYVAIKHRNGITTVSANPVSFASSPFSYTFSDNANKAFGNNMVQMEDGTFALYCGDVNQDGTIDTGDYGLVDNDASDFVSGYVSTDVNGDGSVDTADFTSIDNNNSSFVGSVTP
jgi:hypothetical protein